MPAESYMDHLSDSFLFTECKRWDVKGKSYFDYPNKYYCKDIGLRNARIGFRQQEMTHIMENIIFNELVIRECAVDIGIVYSNEKNAKGRLAQAAREIDFIGMMTKVFSISASLTFCWMTLSYKKRYRE